MSKQLKLFENVRDSKKDSNSNKKLIKDLQSKIEYHQHLYYNEQPEISDEEFDKLWDQLKELDPNNELFTRVGRDNDITLDKVKHIIPMTSQDKVTTPEEFYRWAEKRRYNPYLVQYKLDGISIELQYLKGDFRYGVTRGDGIKGDDITSNVKKMKGFIASVNETFTGAVRGEIILPRSTFNEKYAESKNPRNMASGITKRKDGQGSEDLMIITYDAINMNPSTEFQNESEKLDWLRMMGYDIVDTQFFLEPDEIVTYRDKVMGEVRNRLEIEIDGIVIKGEEIDLNDMKRTHPMKQVAFKFDPEEVESTLLDVEWSESGANYTPVAIISPVMIAGTKVQRASLANPNLINDLNLKINSKVIISKRGDIIPKIERVVENPADSEDIAIPTTCNTCQTPLINEGTRLYCPNEKCSKRDYARLVKWIQKLEVKNFGELILKQLFERERVKKIADLYTLTLKDLTRLERVQEKSAQKALDNLFAVSEISLAKFIGGFNLENVGERMVQKVVDAGFDTLEKLYEATPGDFARVEGFGGITGQWLYERMQSLYFDMLDVLNQNKITIRRRDMGSKKLDGFSFCFTGKLESITRKEAQELVADHGGTSKSGVSSALSYLVTNSTEATAKFTKAQQLGVKIITENEFLAMIE